MHVGVGIVPGSGVSGQHAGLHVAGTKVLAAMGE
jgi:hypothetical protein